MDDQPNIGTAACPRTEESVLAEARQALEELVCFCLGEERTFWEFEKRLLVLLFGLGRVLTRLMLVHRHSRLSLEPYLAMKGYRLGDAYAERKLKTACGEVSYGRPHLIREGGGTGFHPLDVALGLTRDGFSPWVVQFVTRLATRMSYSASSLICKAALGWYPSTEGIEHLVLGLGRQAAPFMQQMGAPPNDGEVLVIEVDGKCPPTATEQELSKRRGKRQHAKGCSCGCQRHRGKAKRKARGSKKRRKKGDKSKNGKEVMVVVMYTLRRDPDGKLHGPINKKIWATFGGRKAAALWAREEATRARLWSGHDQDGTDCVGWCQGVERETGAPISQRDHHAGRVSRGGEVVGAGLSLSQGRERGVEGLGRGIERAGLPRTCRDAGETVTDVAEASADARPGNQGRRQALKKLIGYLKPRLKMMQYRKWISEDLVIASGQVEGAVRHVVGERMDSPACVGYLNVPKRCCTCVYRAERRLGELHHLDLPAISGPTP